MKLTVENLLETQRKAKMVNEFTFSDLYVDCEQKLDIDIDSLLFNGNPFTMSFDEQIAEYDTLIEEGTILNKVDNKELQDYVNFINGTLWDRYKFLSEFNKSYKRIIKTLK